MRTWFTTSATTGLHQWANEPRRGHILVASDLRLYLDSWEITMRAARGMKEGNHD